jgi:hypothetical protein
MKTKEHILYVMFFFISIPLFFISCIKRKKSSINSAKNEVTLYDANTGTKSVIEVNDNMKANGAYKEYYTNGSLKRNASYINGQKDGWEIQYDSTGKMRSKVHFSQNKQNGEALWYSEVDGSLASSSFWINDRQYGEAFRYYPNGSIKKYYVKDFKGDVFYISDYDNQGNILKEDGLVFSPSIFISEADNWADKSYLLKDTIHFSPYNKIGITVATPPGRKSRILISVKDDSGYSNTEEIKIATNTALTNKIYLKRGKYVLSFRGEMLKEGKLIKFDTLVRRVIVD